MVAWRERCLVHHTTTQVIHCAPQSVGLGGPTGCTFNHCLALRACFAARTLLPIPGPLLWVCSGYCAGEMCLILRDETAAILSARQERGRRRRRRRKRRHLTPLPVHLLHTFPLVLWEDSVPTTGHYSHHHWDDLGGLHHTPLATVGAWPVGCHLGDGPLHSGLPMPPHALVCADVRLPGREPCLLWLFGR